MTKNAAAWKNFSMQQLLPISLRSPSHITSDFDSASIPADTRRFSKNRPGRIADHTACKYHLKYALYRLSIFSTKSISPNSIASSALI